MSARRVLITGVSTYWGGRLAQALERDPSVEAIIGVEPGRPDVRARPHGVRPRRHPARAAAADRPRGGDRHGGRHAPDRRQRHRAAARRAREQRDRDDEHPRRLRRRRLAGPQGRRSSRPPTTTAASATTRPSSRRTWSARIRRARALEKDVVEAERAVEAFATRNPDVTVTVLRFANALGPDLRTSHTALLGLPAVPSILGFDPRYQFIHEDDVARRARARRAAHAARRLQRRGRRRARPVGGRLAARQAARARAAAVGDRRSPPARCGALGVRIPPEMLQQLRYGRGLDNRRLKAAGYVFRATSREAVLALAEHLRTPRHRRRRSRLPVRARGGGVPALEPERARVGPARPRAAVAGAAVRARAGARLAARRAPRALSPARGPEAAPVAPRRALAPGPRGGAIPLAGLLSP